MPAGNTNAHIAEEIRLDDRTSAGAKLTDKEQT